jgi:hypothetical protein
MSRSARIAAAAAALAILLGAAGCSGLGSDEEVPERVTGPALVTKAQLDRLPAASPARVVFEWWRALQFDNATIAARYYADDLGMTPDKLDRDLTYGAGALGLTARPRLVDVDENGDAATVNVLLEQLTPRPNGRVDKLETARGFNLVREDGEWKLSENRYLARAGRVQRFFSVAARRQAEQGETTPDSGAGDSSGDQTTP